MKTLIFPMSEKYEEYLIDEAKYCGSAESISFPESEEEVREVLREMRKTGTPITIQGAKTGITGGSIPQGGHIMNLSHMNHVLSHEVQSDGTGWITVEPGLNLMELQDEIRQRFRKNPLFWPPDPTETSASIGGIVAAGAQGISHMHYGPTENYVERIRMVDGTGEVREFVRGEHVVLKSGKEMPTIDLVTGKEGITGVITALTLRLLPKPESVWGIAFFFDEKAQAAAFIDELQKELPASESAAVTAVEYMDAETIAQIEKRKAVMTKIRELPDVREGVAALVYTELQGEEDGIEELAEALMELAAEAGSDPDEAWALSGENDVEKLHAFRHCAAETMNLCIEEQRRTEKRLTKLGTDMQIGKETFGEMLEKYERSIREAGLTGCIFGHALENHLHVNLLPKDYESYQKGIALFGQWAREVQKVHGQVIGEHGLGKLKREILGRFADPENLDLCRELKVRMGTEHFLNPGNIAGDV